MQEIKAVAKNLPFCTSVAQGNCEPYSHHLVVDIGWFN